MRIVILFVSLLFLIVFGAGALWFLSLRPADSTIPLDKYVTIVSALTGMLLSGITTAIAIATLRAKEKEKELPGTTVRKEKLLDRTFGAPPYSMKSGVFGGFIGGLIGGGLAGLINGIHYYYMSQNYPDPRFVPATGADILKISSTVLVVGAIVGVLIQFFILWFRRLAVERGFPGLIFNELFGGIIGGLLGGPFVGLAFGVLSGGRSTPPPDIVPVFGGGILCVLCILLGALFYERKIRLSGIGLAVLISVLVGFFVFLMAAYVQSKLNYSSSYFIKPGAGIDFAVEQGVKLGVPVGALWGIEIGGTLLIYRLVLSLLKSEAKPRTA